MQIRVKSENSESSYYFDDIPFCKIDDFLMKIYQDKFHFQNDEGEEIPHEYLDCSWTINEHGAHLEVVFSEDEDELELGRI